MLSFSARLACAYSAVSAQLNMLGWVLVERPGKVCAAPYLLIRARLAPEPEPEQGLKRGHGLPAPLWMKMRRRSLKPVFKPQFRRQEVLSGHRSLPVRSNSRELVWASARILYSP